MASTTLVAISDSRRRRRLGVARGVPDVTVPEVVPLWRALIGKGKATSVAQHLRVSLEAELGPGASALNQAGEASNSALTNFFALARALRFTPSLAEAVGLSAHEDLSQVSVRLGQPVLAPT
jgi:hypothetical protein